MVVDVGYVVLYMVWSNGGGVPFGVMEDFATLSKQDFKSLKQNMELIIRKYEVLCSEEV